MAHQTRQNAAAPASQAEEAAAGKGAPQRSLTPEAERALAEAAARRAERDCQAGAVPEEGGRGGPDPARYGDWEVKGRAVDF